MSDGSVLQAAKRERLGTAECRRLRREGLVPGNLYGHGEGAVSFKIDCSKDGGPFLALFLIQ